MKDYTAFQPSLLPLIENCFCENACALKTEEVTAGSGFAAGDGSAGRVVPNSQLWPLSRYGANLKKFALILCLTSAGRCVTVEQRRV